MTTRKRGVVGVAAVVSMAVAMLASGCLDRELKPLNPCLVSGVSRTISFNNIDKIDVLFMVDNSNSMADEQESLRVQFPNLINVLTTGERFPGDPDKFPPVKDLHVGVVSSDLGTPGFNVPPNCAADGGPDNGKLRATPLAGNGLTGCQAAYTPPWLAYTEAANGTAKELFANDVACVATLGTGGCGFEQQLEAPFKALWPSVYTDPNTGGIVTPNPVGFLTGTGLGDIPPPAGNAGFLRNSTVQGGQSLIAIIIVTDEEDCSVQTTEHLRPNGLLNLADPHDAELKGIDLNLRCFRYQQNSWPVKERYLDGFRKLRPGAENYVVFAAITGVPTRLVDKAVLPNFKDDSAREAFYDNILGNPAKGIPGDPDMVQVEDPATEPYGPKGTGNLKTSCAYTTSKGTLSTAYPPRRIVQLAKEFGKNGIIQSICQEDFTGAMGAIIQLIADQLGEVCLPRKLVRQRNGQVSCNVVWELPRPGSAIETTPTTCDRSTFLGPVDPGRAAIREDGGVNCKVKQLSVDPTAPAVPATGDGWYYDDFSNDRVAQCKSTDSQRVAFTQAASPPTGVTVKLECLNETQRLADTRTNVVSNPKQPEVGTACGQDVTGATASGDEACWVSFADGTPVDKSLFCHPNFNTCVKQCASSTDCPPAWVCDPRPETLAATNNRPYCVNPTCNVDTTTSM